MKKCYSSFVLVVFAFIQVFSIFFPGEVSAAALGVTKDTLQSSKISYAARVKAPTASGSAHVWIYTSGAACAPTSCYSTSTTNLAPGDTLTIGTGTYTVESIVNASEFTLTGNLAAGDADDGDTIFYKAVPQHTITFTTGSAIANGFFRVLLPAASSNFNDGVPDITGYDFNTTVDIVGTDTAGYTFSPTYTSATASGGTDCPANYHCFEYHYSGAGGNGTAITLKIGNTNGTNTPIAPAPSNTHVTGTGDNYSAIVQNFVNGANPTSSSPTDTTSARVAFIETVRVTVTVDPAITFSITGIASGATACGVTTTIGTNTGPGFNYPLSVPFGTLALNTFATAAHLLTVSTNAANGYAVTAIEDDQLGRDGGTTPFIIDTLCDTGTCSESSAQNWATAASHPGFGYSLESVNLATVPFTAGGSFSTRQFPALADAEAPATIMSSTAESDAHTINICYRISVNSQQAAGNYENQITYTATASF